MGARDKQERDFTLTRQGKDTQITWGTQHIVLKNVPVEAVNAQQHIVMQTHLKVPESYFNSASTVTQLPAGQGKVNLTGGHAFVSVTMETGKMRWLLGGTIYQRNPQFAVNHFVVQAQAPEIKRYGNAIQGFRPGIDKLDLTAAGISRFSEIRLEQRDRGIVNGLATIRGTQITAQLPGVTGKPLELAYLDTVMPAQLSEGDFIVTGVQPKPVDVLPQPALVPPPLVAQGQPADKQAPQSVSDALRHAPIENLMDSMVSAFVPPTNGQVPFSSDYHYTAALAPVMTARWQ